MANKGTTSLVYQANRSEISGFFRDGNDLVIQMTNGNIARIDQFFAQAGGQEMVLLLQESNGSMWQAAFAQRGDAAAMKGYTPFEPDAAMAASLSEVPLPLELTAAGEKWNGYSVEILGFSDDVGKDQGENLPSETRTDDAEPVLHGVAKGLQPGDQIRIYDGDDFLGFADVNADGTWTFAVPYRSEGLHTFSARILTAAGDESAFGGQFLIHIGAGSVYWALGGLAAVGLAAAIGGNSDDDGGGGEDRTPPDTPGAPNVTDNAGDLQGSLGSGDATDDTTPTLSGTGTPGDVITIYDKDTAIGSIAVGEDGTWSYTTPELPDGDHNLTTTAKDAAGNESGHSPAVSITVDTAVPDVLTPELAADTGSADDDGITSDAAITVSGIEPGASWEYRIDGGAWQMGTGAEIPHSAFAAVEDGDHEVQVRQTDAAGNVSQEPHGSLTFTLDTTAPDALTPELAADTGSADDDGITSDAAITVSGIESGASWEYRIDGGAWQMGTGAEIPHSAFAAVGEGDHEVQVRQTDAAGNVSQEPHGSLTFTLDTTASGAPAVGLTEDTGTDGDNLTSDGTLTVSGLESGATWQYSTDGGTSWVDGIDTTIPHSVIAALGDGDHEVLVRQTDAAGNVSQEPHGSLTFTLDTTPPAALTPELTTDTGSADDDRITSDAAITVSGIESGASWEYSIDGGAWQMGTGAEIPHSAFAALGDGDHEVQVRQKDPAGNISGGGSLIFTLDTAAPSYWWLKLTTDTGSDGTDLITSNGEVTVSGLESGATWEYSIDGGSTWVDGTGTTIPHSVIATLGEGLHLNGVAVRQTDLAGNISGTGSLTFVLDTTPPTTTPSIADVIDDVPDPGTTSSIAEGALTNDRTPTITGSGAEAYGLVNIYEGTTLLGSATADSSGNWTAEVTMLMLSNGTHSITARSVDSAGNEGLMSVVRTFVVDANSPAFTVSDDNGVLGTGGTTTDNTPTLSGTGVAGATITISDEVQGVLGAVTVDGNGEWSFTPVSGWDEGQYILTAIATDPAGNLSDPAGPFMLIVDTDAQDPALTANDDLVTAEENHTTSSSIAASDIQVQAAGLDASADLAGSAYADTLTGDAEDNAFEGLGGGDTFNLANGGNDSLIYKVLANSALDSDGGSGHDTVNGFTVGARGANADADRIDVSDLLTGYGPVFDAKAGDPIREYLSARTEGSDTVISIDRDGSGTAFRSTDLVTLNEVNTSLEELAANNQIALF